MNWLHYLLEANLYLAVFYGFYHALLRKQTFYSLNRYFLIASAVTAFILPVIQVSDLNTYMNPPTSMSNSAQMSQVYFDSFALSNPSGLDPVNEFSGQDLILICYFAVATSFLLQSVLSICKILIMAVKSKKTKDRSITYVELDSNHTAFSFFNLLFINPKAQEKNLILKHETIHIRQKHSIDVLFFESIRIISWFNPLVWLLKNDIKLLHEYIADEATTDGTVQKHDYAMFLIQNSFGIVPKPFTNQIFNQSILKRRINMLNQKRSAGGARLRLLLALPIAGGMLCASTIAFSKDYKLLDLSPRIKETKAFVQQEPKKKKPTPAQTPPPPPVPPAPAAVPPPPPLALKSKSEKIKFPPPRRSKLRPGEVIKFPPPIIMSMNQYKLKERNEMKLGEHPIFVNNGEIVKLPARKRYHFEYESLHIYPKNTEAQIELYGEKARDGVIELKNGKIFLR